MMALCCNGKVYARDVAGLPGLWEYVAGGFLTTINTQYIADAVWDGE